MRVGLQILAVTIAALVATDAHALYRRKSNDSPDPDNFLWPRNQGIFVCWDVGIRPEDPLNKRIRATVENGWGRYASFWFEGWRTCTTPDSMPGHFIMIRSISGRSHADVGRQFTPFSGEPRPTRVNIDFSDPIATGCDIGPFGNSREDCVTWVAFHEFGHALGFLHEHARPDAQLGALTCPRAPFLDGKRSGGGTALTTYDNDSVMNGCAADSNGHAQLTWKDVAGLQAVYGMKPVGSIVGPGGRCLDVHNVDVQSGSRVQLWHCWGGHNQRWQWNLLEGTFRPLFAQWACLDDASGGTVPRTFVDIWDCDFRANAHWNLNQVYVQTMGNRCLDLSQGRAVWSGCRFGKEFQWTYTNQQQLRRFGTNRCLVFGREGSQPAMADCDSNRGDQKINIAAWGSALITQERELCLEVPDKMPFSLKSGAIRMARCDTSKLTQAFYFNGFIRSDAGLCLSHARTDISRNGVRAAVQTCFGDPGAIFWDFYPF